MSILQVQQAILTSNLDFPTGSVKTQNQDILVRLAGKYKSVDELRNLVVATMPSGAQVRIRDIADVQDRSEEHTSELQSLMRISYAVFCLKKKKSRIYDRPQRASNLHKHVH